MHWPWLGESPLYSFNISALSIISFCIWCLLTPNGSPTVRELGYLSYISEPSHFILKLIDIYRDFLQTIHNWSYFVFKFAFFKSSSKLRIKSLNCSSIPNLELNWPHDWWPMWLDNLYWKLIEIVLKPFFIDINSTKCNI